MVKIFQFFFILKQERNKPDCLFTERKSGHGYTGFEFNIDLEVSIEEDLERDLTINAIAEDDKGILIDPFNGQKDLNSKN